MERENDNNYPNTSANQGGKDVYNDDNESVSPNTAAPLPNNNQENDKVAKENEEETGNNEKDNVNDDGDDDLNEPSEISTNNNVNNQTADCKEDAEQSPLLTNKPANAGSNDQQIEIVGEHEAEKDEESVVTIFERPYTATLAPLDMELIERLNRERDLKRHHSTASSAAKRRESRSSWARNSVDNSKAASVMFMERERLDSDAGRRAQQQQQCDAVGSVDRFPADHDSHKQPLMSMTNTNTDESFYIDSTTSTLLLEDDQPQSVQFSNYNKQHYNNNHIINVNVRNPATPAVQMTNLAPFEEPTEIELNAPNDYYEKHERNPSLFFDDGIRSIDFVLVYKVNQQQHGQHEEDHAEKRRVFEGNLEAEGLEIERVCKEKEQIYFIKIHAPLEVLRRYAEILKLRMPMKELMCNVNSLSKSSRLRNVVNNISRKVCKIVLLFLSETNTNFLLQIMFCLNKEI